MSKINTGIPKVKGDQSGKGVLGAFTQLLIIMDELRENCPWDKKQTFQSLRYLTIEELYELSDAIVENNLSALEEELGDMLLHIVFYARLAAELGEFEMEDVIRGINKKLINRHPHIYGDVVANDEQTIKENWEKIKLEEKGKTSVLGGVPKSLPALVKALRIQEKARGVGFEWEDRKGVWDKVREEMNEFVTEVERNASSEYLLDEFGDLLFSLVNYGRFLALNAEDALEHTNRKFMRRFSKMEELAVKSGTSLVEMSLQEMNLLWEKVKKAEKKNAEDRTSA